MLTTARIRHRDYVPFGYVAIEFCDVKFFGDNKNFYDNEWRKIEFKKYESNKSTIKSFEQTRESLIDKKQKLIIELNGKSRWWRLWKTQEKNELKTKIHDLNKVIYNLDDQIEILKKESFYEAIDLLHKAEDFLDTNEFVYKNNSCEGGGCPIKTEIWELQ